MNKKRILLIVIVSNIMGLVFYPEQLLVEANVKEDDYLCYDIIDASEETNFFYGYWPPGQYFGEWAVNCGDKIWYNITSVKDTEINGTLKIGEIIFEDVRNIDIAFSLSLSINPWMGGFIANSSNWEMIKEMVQGTNTTIERDEINFEMEDGHRLTESYRFTVENYNGQNSELIYDINTGILLKGYTNFGNYTLEIKVKNTNISIGKITTQKSLIPFIIVILAIISLSFQKIKRDN